MSNIDPKELKDILTSEVKKASEAAKKETIGEAHPYLLGFGLTVAALATFKGVEAIVGSFMNRDEAAATPMAAASPGLDAGDAASF